MAFREGRRQMKAGRTGIWLLCQPKSVEQGVALARAGRADGADGVCFELKRMPEKERTVDAFRTLVAAAELPTIFCDYRNDSVFGGDDEARMAQLLLAAEAGADFVDVMGDLYEPSFFELAMSAAAIERQRRTIEAVHARGAKALMSSHGLDPAVTRTADEIVAHLREQERRGADVLKLVTPLPDERAFSEAVAALGRLSTEVSKPWIYLGSGAYGRLQRFIGPSFGCAVEFALHALDPEVPLDQPTIREFRQGLSAIGMGIADKMKPV